MNVKYLVRSQFTFTLIFICGMRYHSGLRHYDASQKIVGSNPNQAIGFAMQMT
jgi:hypothetical protein